MAKLRVLIKVLGTITICITIFIACETVLETAYENVVTFEVTDKAPRTDQHPYKIYGEDQTTHASVVFVIEESLLYRSFDTAGIYQKLKKDDRVTVLTIGYRNPWLSWIPNIVEVLAVSVE